MPGVVLHSGHMLDDLSNAGQGPKLRAKAMCHRAAQQLLLQRVALHGRELRFSACAARALKSLLPLGLPVAVPAHHALAADVECPGDRGLRLALLEQVRRTQATASHLIKVPLGSARLSHTGNVAYGRSIVTLFCEIL